MRRDPPTLEEAIFAAKGLTDNLDEQVEIAASLMGVAPDTIRGEIAKTQPRSAGLAGGTIRQIEVNRGSQRTVVVEKKAVRRRLVNK